MKKKKKKRKEAIKQRIQHIRKALATLPPSQEKELRVALFNDPRRYE